MFDIGLTHLGSEASIYDVTFHQFVPILALTDSKVTMNNLCKMNFEVLVDLINYPDWSKECQHNSKFEINYTETNVIIYALKYRVQINLKFYLDIMIGNPLLFIWRLPLWFIKAFRWYHDSCLITLMYFLVVNVIIIVINEGFLSMYFELGVQ